MATTVTLYDVFPGSEMKLHDVKDAEMSSIISTGTDSLTCTCLSSYDNLIQTQPNCYIKTMIF